MNNTMDNLYENINKGDSEGYLDLKYQNYQEGDNIVFEGKDFNNLDMTKFALAFTIFKKCTLNNVKVCSQPIGFKESVATLDLRGQHGVIIAEDTDFTGTKYDQETSFHNSYFSRCTLDNDFKEFITGQGALFTEDDVITSKMGEY